MIPAKSSKDAPKVSICVPVYNVEDYIQKSASTFFEQSLSDVEYIFVDDCSTDKSISKLEEVIAAYPERKHQTRVIKLKENSGPWTARRKAASYASGDYVYFPDADDCLEPTMLEEMYNRALSEQADIVICWADSLRVSGIKTLSNVYDDPNRDWIRFLFTDRIPGALWWRLIKRDVLGKALEEDISFRLTRFEDFYLVVKCHYFAKKVSVVEKILYHKNDLNVNSLKHNRNTNSINSGIFVGRLLGDFFMKQGSREHYIYEVEGFKYKRIFPLIYSSMMWNPELWRKYSSEINVKHLRDDVVRTPKFLRKTHEFLIKNKYDSLARCNLHIIEIIISVVKK